MKMETLMSGIKGEGAHIFYKEEDGSHMRSAYDYDFMIVLSFFLILLLIVV